MSSNTTQLTKDQEAIRAASRRVEEAFADLTELIRQQSARAEEGSDGPKN